MTTQGMALGRYRSKARVASKAGESLRMPKKAPRCWLGRQSEWEQYRADANFSAGRGFTFCTDCNPAHKAEMVKQGKCQYPKTIFTVNNGVLVGRRRK